MDKKAKKNNKAVEKKVKFVDFISFERTKPFQDRLQLKKK